MDEGQHAGVAGLADSDSQPFNGGAGAISDFPAERDLLGFAPLVEGLRALLSTQTTNLPIAIGITAAWGAGKSSVMLQLRNLLREPGTRQPQERKWWTVDFPAWKYEHGERLWAALAKAVYEQPQEDMSWRERVRFRVRIERERLGWRNFLLKGAWPPLAAAGAASVALATNLDPVGSTPLTVGVSSLAAFSAGAVHYWGVASMPFKRAIQSYASAPDYDEKLGFTADADHDIRSLARVLAPDTEADPQALAVFVDDLDRCSSLHVVEVVEAMNQIFNSDGRHGCVFILGLDREVVATNIEVAYGPTVRWLRRVSRRRGEDFGMQFLAKLVQIVVTMPQPSDTSIRRMLTSVRGNPDPEGESEVEEEDVRRVERAIRRLRPETLAAVSSVAAAAQGSPRARELAARRVRAEMIQSSPEVLKAELELLPHVGRNPRQVKRFDNAFRLQVYVANEDPRCQLAFTFDELVALGRWVVLRMRWPDLADVIDAEPMLLEMIEATANEVIPAMPSDEYKRLRDADPRWFEEREVLAVLKDGEAGRAQRVSALSPGSFLRVA